MKDNRHGEFFSCDNFLIYSGEAGIYFYDFYNWDEIDNDIQFFMGDDGNGILGYVGSEVSVGCHVCNKSKLYENMEGYVDTIQHEHDLPDGKYVVTHYVCDDNYDLLQYVDYGITKEQIIANVEAQKYVESAEYYLMESMREFIK